MKPVKKILKLIIEGGKQRQRHRLGQVWLNMELILLNFVINLIKPQKICREFKFPVEVTIYEDRTFSFVLKKPPISYLIKRELGIEKGAHETGREIVGVLTKEQLRKIAEEKLPDLNTKDIEKAMKIVAGVARSMGVKVEI
jgi:large subunit ribosomal protein L11